MEMSEKIDEFAAALATAQASFGKLIASKQGKIEGKSKKSGKEFSYSYTYANLADALSACRETLNTNGIAVWQDAATSEKSGVEITTMLIHSSGQWIKSSPLFMPVSGGAQDVGSAVTYGRRYGLLAAAGMAPEDDDDGSAAQGAKPATWGAGKAAPSSSTKKSDAIGARCSGDKWPGDLGREIDQLVQDLATLDGDDPGSVWWPLLEDAGVNQQPYMDTDGEWPGMARVLSTSDGKLVKATALKKIDDARQT